MNRITLKNFRCFRKEQTARLAPLTLLVGENSTGKTSFIAMIRALWEVAYRERVPDFKEEPYDLGSFNEIAHYRGGRGGRADSFEAGFDFTPGRAGRDRGAVAGICRFETTFRKKGTAPVPVRMRLASKNIWLECNFQNEDSWSFEAGIGSDVWRWEQPADRWLSMDDDRVLPFFFMPMGWLSQVGDRESNPELPRTKRGRFPTDNELELINQLIFALSPYSLGRPGRLPYASAPVRSKPRRTYDPARPTRDPEGDYIPMYLSSLYFQNKQQWKILKGELEKFGKIAGLFDEISVRPLGKKGSEPFQIQIRKLGSRIKGPHRNLIDVGYGVSQVLPVITELFRDSETPMFLLQQPEVHLHPSAQAALGSLFCQIAGRQRQLVVETHSDHLLDRVRMDIRDGVGKLKPEDVSILFFERRDLDVDIRSLELDGEGNVLKTPSGYRQFFMEETERSVWGRQNL